MSGPHAEDRTWSDLDRMVFDGARIFYLQRTDRPGWGELKSIGVDGSTPRTHGTFGPLRPYEMNIGVSPRDEIAFALYREGPHELWMAQLR